MAITSTPIPTIMTDDYQALVSSVSHDTLTWSASINTTSITTDGTTGTNGTTGTGYVYTSPNTVPWIGGAAGSWQPTVNVQQGTGLEIQGEDADIKINGKSMRAWMEAVEERLNILTPNPELEAEWDDLRRLGERYKALERKCKEKAKMWAALKKVQPQQP